MLKSEREKMISGELYNFQTEELKEDRLRAKELLRQFNEAGVREFELRKNDNIIETFWNNIVDYLREVVK